MARLNPRQPYRVVILCGGLGLRMGGRADCEPKSLVNIGPRPVLWHIMKLYSHWGFRDFILPLGHGGDAVIAFFERFLSLSADFTLRLGDGDRDYHTQAAEDEREWSITFVHAGIDTETGGRLRRAAPYIHDEHFLATYADGLSDVDIRAVLAQHLDSGADATLLSVQLPTSFGIVESHERLLTRFDEKPLATCQVNGGFFVFRRSVLDEIDGDAAVLEKDLLPRLAGEGRVGVFPHHGYWHCMDTPKHVAELNRMWESGEAPWKVWDD